MEANHQCPVPANQIPIEEFKELSNSYFFSIAKKNNISKHLFISWIHTFPIAYYIIQSGIDIKHQLTYTVINSSILSLIIPFLLTARLLLGWTYINNRLLSKAIEYEETGWQDGQIWIKPNSWLEQDNLISQYQVKPLLIKLKKIILIIIGLAIIGFLISYS